MAVVLLCQQARSRKGDEFITIDGDPVRSWDQRRLYLYERALDRATVTFTVRDLNGLTQERALDLSSLSAADVGAGLLERQIGLFPPLPELEPVIGTLDERGAAALAGLQVGDRVIAIDGQPVKTWQDMVKTVSARPEVSLRLRVQRNGATQEFSVT